MRNPSAWGQAGRGNGKSSLLLSVGGEWGMGYQLHHPSLQGSGGTRSPGENEKKTPKTSQTTKNKKKEKIK